MSFCSGGLKFKRIALQRRCFPKLSRPLLVLMVISHLIQRADASICSIFHNSPVLPLGDYSGSKPWCVAFRVQLPEKNPFSYWMTAAHCITPGRDYAVFPQHNRSIPLSVIASDNRVTDWALLKGPYATGPAYPIYNASYFLPVGETIGMQTLRLPLIEANLTEEAWFKNGFFSEFKSQPGDSGSPIIYKKHVIGVHTGIHRSGRGLESAIPGHSFSKLFSSSMERKNDYIFDFLRDYLDLSSNEDGKIELFIPYLFLKVENWKFYPNRTETASSRVLDTSPGTLVETFKNWTIHSDKRAFAEILEICDTDSYKYFFNWRREPDNSEFSDTLIISNQKIQINLQQIDIFELLKIYPEISIYKGYERHSDGIESASTYYKKSIYQVDQFEGWRKEASVESAQKRLNKYLGSESSLLIYEIWTKFRNGNESAKALIVNKPGESEFFEDWVYFANGEQLASTHSIVNGTHKITELGYSLTSHGYDRCTERHIEAA